MFPVTSIVRWFSCLTVVLLLSAISAALEPSDPPAIDPPEPLTWDQESQDDSLSEEAEELAPLADLEQLLEIADRDVEALSQFRVQPAARGTNEQFNLAPSLATEVSTVTRQKSTVRKTPAAVTVITAEMIRRSGANNIPDLLRMVPGVQVARIDANKWAISIRGSNNRFANKLLVQVDGRSIYTPLFGGTFWDVQDLPLENIARIEIVRGPGASVWGANAVNGVINIITKKSSQTQGLYVRGGAGTEERGFTTLQYGGQVGDALTYRTYGKWFERDTAFDPDNSTHDDWRQGRGGFRVDWQPDDVDQVSVQGDFYGGTSGQRSIYPTLTNIQFVDRLVEDAHVRGENLVFNWTHRPDECSDWSLTAFYDRTHRRLDGIGFEEDRQTFDIDFQRGVRIGDFQRLVWGARYRNTSDEISSSTFSISYRPLSRSDDTYSGFIQDELTLTESLSAVLGAKLSDNNYTGFEFQPTARLIWSPSDHFSAWTAVSRAVRVPTRSADDLQLIQQPLPLGVVVFPVLRGQRRVEAEDLIAMEAGVRSQPNDWLSWDIATYYHDYRDLILPVPGAITFDPSIGAAILPAEFRNAGAGYSYGVEWTSHCRMTDGWEMHAAYTFLNLELFPDPRMAGSSPRNQLYLQSSWDLLCSLELDVAWRYVGSLPSEVVAPYNVMDVRLAWQPNANLEWSFVGRNLLDKSHPEFGDDLLTGVFATEVQREFFTYFTLRR